MGSLYFTIKGLESIHPKLLDICVFAKLSHALMPLFGLSTLKTSYVTSDSITSLTGTPLECKIFLCFITNQYRVDRETSLTWLCETNQYSFSLFQTLSLAFNFCLCHDLVKTLIDPFYPGKRRMNKYLICSVIATIIFTASSRKALVSNNKIFN